MAAAESYPDDLRYHPEHDWARLEDGEADSLMDAEAYKQHVAEEG